MASAQNYSIAIHSDLATLDADTERRLTLQMKNLALASFAGGSEYGEQYANNWESIFAQSKDRPINLYRIVTALNDEGEIISFCTARKYIIGCTPVLYFGFMVTDPHFRNTAVTKDVMYAMLDIEEVKKLSGGYFIAKTANPTTVELTRLYLHAIAAQIDIIPTMIPSFGPNGDVDLINDDARAFAKKVIQYEGGFETFDENSFRISGISESSVIYDGMNIRYRNNSIGKYFRSNVDVNRGDSQIIMFHLKRR
jgi:hypothetical protein